MEMLSRPVALLTSKPSVTFVTSLVVNDRSHRVGLMCLLGAVSLSSMLFLESVEKTEMKYLLNNSAISLGVSAMVLES